ncbi:hypothetical protein Tco_0805196 [Tanacetum coccineum]
MRGRGGKIQKQKRNPTEEEEKNVAESLVGTLLHVSGKTKDGVNARLDLAELGVKPKLFAMQEEDKTTLPPAGYTLKNAEKDTFCEMLHNIRVPQGYCSNFSSLVNLKDNKLIGLKSHDYHMLIKEIILQELDKMLAELVVTLCLLEKFFPLSFFDIMIHLTVHLTRSEYHKSMETIGIPPEKHETNENEVGKPLSADKSSEVSMELFQKAHLYVIQNTDDIVPYIEHKQVLKTENLGKRIAFLENEHSKSFAKWLRKEVERELAISKESVSETVRWISYGPRATVVKYDAYNINGAGGVKRDNLGYTLVDLNNLGHKVDPFILASQARQVFYVKDQIDKKLSIVFKTPPKNYKDTYDEVDEEFSTVIHQRCVMDTKDIRIDSNPFLRPYPHTILYHIIDFDLAVNISQSFNWEDFLNTSEEIDYDSLEPPKSFLKWYHYLSDEYKDNGSTDNESTDMETTDKRNTDKDCIVDSNSAMSKGSVLGLPNVTTWDEIEKKIGARKSKTYADKAKGKRKLAHCICSLHMHIAFVHCICSLHLQASICTLHLQIAYAHCICTLHLQLAFASKHLHIAFAG